MLEVVLPGGTCVEHVWRGLEQPDVGGAGNAVVNHLYAHEGGLARYASAMARCVMPRPGGPEKMAERPSLTSSGPSSVPSICMRTEVDLGRSIAGEAYCDRVPGEWLAVATEHGFLFR